MTRRLIRPKEFMEKLGVSKTTFWRMRVDGKLPKPVQISDRIIAWPSDVVDKVIDDIVNKVNV